MATRQKQGIKKVEKETRKLISANSSMIKPREEGGYKFRSKLKKKQVKQIKTQCVHFIERKGKITPTVTHDPDKPGNWKCTICGASFPRKPLSINEIDKIASNTMEMINQAQFYSVLMGGDNKDTKLFSEMKILTPRLRKTITNINKAVDKRAQYEDRKKNTGNTDMFGAFGGYDYNNRK